MNFAATVGRVRLVEDLHLVRRLEAASAGALFVLEQRYTVQVELDGTWTDITVPAGYITDMASVPRGFRWLVGKLDGIEAAVVHDYLHDLHRLEGRPGSEAERRFADQVYRAVHIASGSPAWRRIIMYGGVRAGGWATFYAADPGRPIEERA